MITKEYKFLSFEKGNLYVILVLNIDGTNSMKEIQILDIHPQLGILIRELLTNSVKLIKFDTWRKFVIAFGELIPMEDVDEWPKYDSPTPTDVGTPPRPFMELLERMYGMEFEDQ